jgi:hypothetical protein
MSIDNYVEETIKEIMTETSYSILLHSIFNKNYERYIATKQYTDRQCKIKALAETEELIKRYTKNGK